MLNLLILAAEPLSEQARYPVFLDEDGESGLSILNQIFQSMEGVSDFEATFVFQEDLIKKFHLDNMAKVLCPNSRVVHLPKSTQGSACTALYSACSLPLDRPLLVVSTNERVKVNYQEVLEYFEKSRCDGGLLTFPSVHPRYSFARLDDKGRVTEVAQQNPISNHATSGTFWYRKTADFIDSAKISIAKGATTSHQYYIAPVFNQMILQNKTIGAFALPSHCYTPFKPNTPSQAFSQEASKHQKFD